MSECHKTGLQYIIVHQSEILASILSELMKNILIYKGNMTMTRKKKSCICQMLELKRIFKVVITISDTYFIGA